MPFTRPKGTQDLLPAETPRWQWLEETFRRRCARYGYQEIRTPIFESTGLFTRSVGEETDIVGKQMYSFESKGHDQLTLRPEGTAPTVRAVIENKLLQQGGLVKLYYMGPIFRYERPQSGRYRQFHQVGVEAIGAADPEIDAEILAFAAGFLRDLGIDSTTLELNSVGCPDCRPRYRDALRNALSGARTQLCADCHRRYDTNPLRILDCKVESCRVLSADVPVMLDVLCDACKAHLQGVEDNLRALGVEYVVNPHIVRGLDYYTRTAFEFISSALGAQSTVLAGGRYDGMVEELGGPPTPGIGFGAGIERLLMAAGETVPLPEAPGPLFIATLGAVARRAGFVLAEKLRRAGIPALTDYGERSLKAQMREANRKGAWYTIVLGENELASGEAALRDMRAGTETPLALDTLEAQLGARYQL